MERIKRRNWTLNKMYSDNGVSGASENRPGLNALLSDVKRGRVNVFAVWSLDRMARLTYQRLTPGCRQSFPYLIMEGLPVTPPQSSSAGSPASDYSNSEPVRAHFATVSSEIEPCPAVAL
jgi:hypothetical protein